MRLLIVIVFLLLAGGFRSADAQEGRRLAGDVGSRRGGVGVAGRGEDSIAEGKGMEGSFRSGRKGDGGVRSRRKGEDGGIGAWEGDLVVGGGRKDDGEVVSRRKGEDGGIGASEGDLIVGGGRKDEGGVVSRRKGEDGGIEADGGSGDGGEAESRYLTGFRFRVLFGGIIIGKARIDDFPDSLNFIFDTGCGSVSLDSATAVRFGLVARQSSAVIHGVAGVCPQRLVDNQSLHLGDVSIDSLSMQVCDYDILSSIYGEKIDGIIGYSLFSRYLVKVNYDDQRMELYTKGAITYPKGGFLLKPRLYGLPMLEGQVADARDVRSRFYFDTGAGLCLLFSSNFATDSAVFSHKRKKPVRIEGAGLGGKTEMQLTTLRNFSLGPFRFRQIPTYIFEDAYDVTSYPQLAGLIGNDLLRRFNLIVNYDRSEIYILPNTAYNQPFDYSYSGISIALIERKIVVTDVMPDSPGARAGFREGDVVLAINGDAGQDLQTYQGLLKTIGPKVKVLVRRDGGNPVMLYLKVTSIL